MTIATILEYNNHINKNDDKWNKTSYITKYKNDSCDFCLSVLIAMSIAYIASSLDLPPPIKAFSRPNIKHNVEVVIQSKPNPIEHALITKNAKLKIWASDPTAALIAANVNPT